MSGQPRSWEQEMHASHKAVRSELALRYVSSTVIPAPGGSSLLCVCRRGSVLSAGGDRLGWPHCSPPPAHELAGFLPRSPCST